MSKQHYFFKLIPPRPTFMRDITDEERRFGVLLFGPGWQAEERSDSVCGS